MATSKNKLEALTISEATAIIADAKALCIMMGRDSSAISTPTGNSASESSHSFVIGESVFIRSVTHYYVGKVVSVTKSDIVLESASWVADCARQYDMLKTGITKVMEIEPYPDGVRVARGGIIDTCPWVHDLPKAQQ